MILFVHVAKNFHSGRGSKHSVEEENVEENVEEEPHIIVTDVVTKHYRRFSIEGREIRVKIQPPPFDVNVYEWLEIAMQELYRLCATTAPEDFISVTLSSERFVHGPAWISFRCVSDLSAYDLWDKLESVAQSADNFEIDDKLLVSCSIVSVPVGLGRVALTHESVFKRSILTIRNDDNLCLPRSLVVAYVHAIRGQIRSGTVQTEWTKIRASRLKYQTECAQTFVCDASVIIPEGGCGLNEIHAFQIFSARLGIVIIIYSFQRFGRVYI